MKLKQTMGIVLISILLLSVTAITTLASDDTNTYNATVMKSHTESVAPDLIAAFTASHHPYQPLTIRFNEESIGNPVPYRWGTKYGLMTYFWDFGDNTTCIEHNPEHQFKKPGTYRVYLKLEDAEGKVSKAVTFIDVEQ